MQDYDVICLSETKMHNINVSDSLLDGYSCFMKQNMVDEHRYGGVHGLCMFIKDKYFKFANVLNDLSSPYILWVRFVKEAFGFDCVIGSVYIPCETSKYKDKEKFNVIYDDIKNITAIYNIPICVNRGF